MNLSGALSDSVAIVADLIKDIEAVVAKKDSGLIAEGVDLVEIVLADADVRAHISSLVANIKG